MKKKKKEKKTKLVYVVYIVILVRGLGALGEFSFKEEKNKNITFTVISHLLYACF